MRNHNYSTQSLLVLCGPTGLGKSEVAIELAELVGGEIVSADSALVYRGMDIGTAKPSLEYRARIPHHLIDVADPTESYNVARYQQQARRAIAEINEHGKLPLLVGGTGLYIRAVVDDLQFPKSAPPLPSVREALMEQARNEGASVLHARLAQMDAEAAQRIHPHNIKRIVRALEVALQIGTPLPVFPKPTSVDIDPDSPRRYTLRIFGLTMERERLSRRLDERIDQMIAADFLAEVRALRERGVLRHQPSQQALGYRHMHRLLDGEMAFDAAVREWKRDTRRFAKRQWTWFRSDPRVEWLDIDNTVSPRDVALKLRTMWMTDNSEEIDARLCR